ncbi:HET-domain-containing protein, partial [Ophiobolus disseminans]
MRPRGFQPSDGIRHPDTQRLYRHHLTAFLESRHATHQRCALQLERFDDDTKIPPFAILSHTWGSEEVSLQQLDDAHTGDDSMRIRIKGMLGYTKIAKTCKQALDDGYAYAWVDTCCIDKSSSAELSEAINSMFRWYQEARVCYAFWKMTGWSYERFEKARWFTRGWTLQEQIAPHDVRFYAAGRVFIGSKASMADPLSSITGIYWNVLADPDSQLERQSVARRMSWAASRTTTRIEDIAYSLMGLFGVNMPLLYGEGKKAFVRLQEEVLREHEDQSLFAW